ncbi:hypothetical protein CapIbe_015455 [Capra ibex]
MGHRLQHHLLEPRSLTAGYPLSCEVCVSDGPSCTGKLQTCAPDEDSCVVVVTETNRKASLAEALLPEGWLQPGPPPAFMRNHTENGLRCPSCIAAFTETCTASEEALCVGEETRCVTVSGLVQPAGVKFAARGCGMETACHTKPGTLVPSGARLFTIKKTSCL